MTWMQTVLPLVLGLALLLVPGALIGWAFRLRGISLIAAAPVFSVSVVSVSATLGPLVGVPWSVLLLTVVAVLCALAVLGIRRLAGRRWPETCRARTVPSSDRAWVPFLAVLFAAALISSRLIYVFGAPENISQTLDNIFHLNAIQYILETGKASSLTLGSMIGIPFYPSSWHALAGLLVQITGVSIPVAVNVLNVAISAAVWPLGCVYLARTALGTRPAVSLVAGVVSAGFGAFPILMVDFGVLYPSLLGFALLPGVLAIALQLFGVAKTSVDSSPVIRGVMLLAAVPGISLAHPTAVMSLIVFLVPVAIIVYFSSISAWRTDWAKHRVRFYGWTVAMLGALVVVLLMWVKLRPPADAAFWPPVQSVARALLQVFTSSMLSNSPAYLIAALVCIGLALMVVRKQWTLLSVFIVGSMLFVVVSSFQQGRLRDFVTGVWYNDSFRLAALLPTALLLPAVIGGVFVWSWISRRIGAGRLDSAMPDDARSPAVHPLMRAMPKVAAALGVAVLVGGTQLLNVPQAADSAHRNYELTDSSQLLTKDEMAVIGELDAIVPPGAVIASNPWNGSALAYGLGDRRTLQLHVLSDVLPDVGVIYSSLREATTDPAVCPVVKRLNVQYVLDFGTQEVNGGSHPTPGLVHLENSDAVKLVDKHGEAKLFKVTACG